MYVIGLEVWCSHLTSAIEDPFLWSIPPWLSQTKIAALALAMRGDVDAAWDEFSVFLHLDAPSLPENHKLSAVMAIY